MPVPAGSFRVSPLQNTLQAGQRPTGRPDRDLLSLVPFSGDRVAPWPCGKLHYNQSMNPNQSFLDARDFLIAHREDYAAAYAGFRWPQLDRFNWALDYFDPFAQGNVHLALWVVDEHGGDSRLTFAAMSERSNRVANFLRERGVRRGDRVLVMLGNVV